MKKLIFSSLIGLALVAFTGCYGPTTDTTVEEKNAKLANVVKVNAEANNRNLTQEV